MKIGDIVQSANPDVVLASGCSRYKEAIVVNLEEPFALCSLKTDMLWECTLKKEDFVVTGEATPEQMKATERRWLP